MAARALRAEAASMHIVRSVARAAFGFCVPVSVRDVALLAGNGNMEAHERKARQVMIEPDYYPPIFRRMAGVTLDAKLPGMNIAGAMTRDTCRAQLLRGRYGCMARMAFHLGVPAL
jgi:hypothetical protein